MHESVTDRRERDSDSKDRERWKLIYHGHPLERKRQKQKIDL